MLEARILGSRAGGMSRVPILQSDEPAHGGMPQVGPAVPECDLGLDYPVGLSQPGSLELSEGSQGGGEIIVQGDVGWLDRMRLQEDSGRLACFLNQSGHVVRETLRVPDFETKGPRRLKLSLVHPKPSRYWLSPPIAE